MAKRTATAPDAPEPPRVAMARHIRALGLADPQTYLAWCEANGVAATLDKTAAARAQELEIAAAAKRAADARTRLHRNPRRFIEACCEGAIDPATIDRPGWREVAAAIARNKDRGEKRKRLAEFLLHLERTSDLVFATTEIERQPVLYLEGIIRLHERRGQWIRDPAVWRPQSHNAARQFSSLARHLIARYEVPAFLDSAWLRTDRGASRYRDWFAHIAAGGNIRTAKTPYPFTKMMAHHFVHAPGDVTIEGALMLADIKALGGGERLANAMMGTRLGTRIETNEERRTFWLSVYRFFIANPMLDLRHAGPIVDFLAHQKFETQEVMVGPGRAEVRQPPQPNLTMARRTPESLLRQVEAWHGELRTIRANDNRFWKSSGIPGLSVQTGPRDRPEEQLLWTFRELLSSQDLIDNGRRMKHCVASYAQSCVRGACSIWTLERRYRDSESARGDTILTLEVDAARTLVQARGQQNRMPTDPEKALITQWMTKANLKPGRYLYGW
jgi:hypothetical protein